MGSEHNIVPSHITFSVFLLFPTPRCTQFHPPPRPRGHGVVRTIYATRRVIDVQNCQSMSESSGLVQNKSL
jgi:hypothetical protein